jgi:hypothetical protein
MREVVIGATILLLLSGTARAAEGGTGNQLLESCRSLLDSNYNPISSLQQNLDSPSVNGSDIVAIFNRHEERGMCLGMVGAVRDVMDAERGAHASPGPLKRACIPYEVKNGQLVRVVVGFMDQHPELLHYRLSALAFIALAQTWPCPQGAR